MFRLLVNGCCLSPPASTSYGRTQPELARAVKGSCSEGKALALDGPQSEGTIAIQVEAEDRVPYNRSKATVIYYWSTIRASTLLTNGIYRDSFCARNRHLLQAHLVLDKTTTCEVQIVYGII